jgi:DNA repair protein RadD
LIILDHAGNTERLGLVTDVNAHVDWLDDGQPRRNLDRGSQKDAAEPKIRLCPECRIVLPPRPIPACPECGHKFPAITLVKERDGELVEYRSGRKGKAEASDEFKTKWHSALLYIAFQKGYKPGWAANKYRERFGHWPSRYPPPMREPTVEIRIG